jgi:hypothetical protein
VKAVAQTRKLLVIGRREEAYCSPPQQENAVNRNFYGFQVFILRGRDLSGLGEL